MLELGISRIRQSTFVTVSMIALGVAGIVSWILLLAGAAAIESEKEDDTDSLFGGSGFGGSGFEGYGITLGIDVGFSWWILVYTGILYALATLSWLLSMAKGVSVFVAASQPLALLFAVALAWTGVEMRHARPATGTTSSVDAWFTGLFFTACTVGLGMLFFSCWQSVVGTKPAAPAPSVHQKQIDVAVVPGGPAPPGFAVPGSVHYNAVAVPQAGEVSPGNSAYEATTMA